MPHLHVKVQIQAHSSLLCAVKEGAGRQRWWAQVPINNCKSYINFFPLAKWSFWKPNIWAILTINLPVLIAISSHLSFHSQNVTISSLSWVKSEIHYLVFEKVEKQRNTTKKKKKVNIRLIESLKSVNVIMPKEQSFIIVFHFTHTIPLFKME